jgi:acyl carrier protein
VSAQDPLLDAVRAVVERVAGPSRAPAHAGPETRLTEGYWLDSVELLEVLIACETAFGIVFDNTRDLEGGAFDTLGTLTRLVRSKLPAPRCSA